MAESLDLVLDAGHPGQDQNRRLYLGDPERAQDLVARHVEQVEIEQNDVVSIKVAESDVLDVAVQVPRLQHQFNTLRGPRIVFDQKSPHVRLPASPVAS